MAGAGFGRMAATHGVGSSGSIFHLGGVGSSAGRAACATLRCTRATGIAMDRRRRRALQKAEAPRRRPSEARRWNREATTDEMISGGSSRNQKYIGTRNQDAWRVSPILKFSSGVNRCRSIRNSFGTRHVGATPFSPNRIQSFLHRRSVPVHRSNSPCFCGGEGGGDDDNGDGRRARACFSFAVAPVSKFDAVDFYFVILPLSVDE